MILWKYFFPSCSNLGFTKMEQGKTKTKSSWVCCLWLRGKPELKDVVQMKRYSYNIGKQSETAARNYEWCNPEKWDKRKPRVVLLSNTHTLTSGRVCVPNQQEFPTISSHSPSTVQGSNFEIFSNCNYVNAIAGTYFQCLYFALLNVCFICINSQICTRHKI